jgi:RHS repeat-associated protein
MKRRNTLALAALMLPIPLGAQAQTGVSDDRVSLPEGPGSLEGVGESVRPNLNMGTMSWNVPIPVPQGFPGVTPELGLRYDSGAGSGAVGIGWSMDVPAIERLTLRGLPDYDLDDEFTAEGGQLVRVSQNPLVYRARDERGFTRYTWVEAGDGAAGYWLAEYPDGRKGYFGATHEGRAVATARHEDAGRTFRYALVDMVDVFGHRLHYTYQRDDAQPGQVGASLLLAVDWVYAQGDAGESTYQVAFAYEPASDPTGQSVVSDAKAGFDVRTVSRLREVSVFSRGQRIRRMRLSYEPYADAGGFTRLTRVETLGQRDGVYPVRFDFAYSQALGGQCADADCRRPYMVDMGDVDLDPTSGQATLIDINGDGLPDLMHAPPNGNQRFFLNVPDPDGGSAFGAPVPSNFGGQQFQLTSGRVQPLDVDGDGFCDLLNTRTAEVLYNRGLGDWAEAGNLLDVGALANLDADFELGAGADLAGIRFLDFDNDKRIDLLRSSAQDTNIYRNLGGGGFEAAPGVEALGYGIRENALTFADMNGDGLQDAVVVQIGSIRYRVNYGHGQWGPEIRLAGAPIDNDEELAKHSLEDINGDGLADVVVVVGRTVKFAISRNGQGFFQVRTLTSQDLEAGGQIPDRQDRNVLFADMNANGSQDVVWLGRGGDIQYLELFPVRPNLLTRITNGIGSVIDVAYGTSVEHIARGGEPWDTPLPHPMLVVDRIDTWDELSEEHEVDTFAYRNGFYDGVEKQFRGYARVVQTLVGDEDHEEGTQTVTFDVGQDDVYRHGLQLTSVQTSAGRTLRRTESEYEDCPVAEVPANGLRFPVRHLCQVGTTTVVEEGRPAAEHVTLETHETHDGYGNVVSSENLGVTRIGGGACPACPAGRSPDDFGAPCGPMCLGDEQFTETEYVSPQNTGGRWILHAATRTRSFGREGSPLVSETLNYYDGADFEGLALGQLTHGKVSRTTVAKAAGEAPIVASRVAFDEHGNVIATIDPLGTPDGNTHRREYTYDAEGLRVVGTDILLEDPARAPYRLRRETTYEPLFDKVSESTAWMRVENGQVLSPRRSSSFAYDQFGRLTKRVLPGGDTLQNPTEEYVYELASPVSRILARKRSQVGGAYDLESASCMDGRGRSTQSRTRLAQGRWQVGGFTVYDRRSTPKAVYQPFIGMDGACETSPPAGVLAERFAFDSTERRLTATHPDSDVYGTASVSRTEYLPLATRAWDENDTDARSPHANTPTTQKTDGLGRLTAIERLLAANGPPAVLTAHYDGLGRLTGYTDDAGNEKSQTYDLAGRLLEIDDPNAGVTQLTYDDAGNVLTRTDARGETVAMAYDGANRPVAKWNPEDEAGSRIMMRYDGCDAEECSNPEGLLSEVTYPGPGLERQGFDLRGRPIYFAREIDGHLFAQRNTFDNADRLRSSTYPDGREIERRYDDAGRLTTIDGIVAAVEYDPRGVMMSMERADGSADTLAYDSRLRPTSLATTVPGGLAQDLGFTRDRVGNLLSVADTSGQGPNASVEYVHDAWYRTREAHLSIGGQDETLGWQFDTLDNIVSRTSSREADAHGLTGAFSYDGAGPNAVTAAGDLTLEYDAAGYVTRRGERALTWDYQGRLTSQGAGGENAYGADATRVKARADGSVTHYALPDFDVRDGISSLYVRVGRARVARLDSESLATTLLTDHNGDDRIDAGDAAIAEEGEGSESEVDALLWSAVRRQLLDHGHETTQLHADHLGSLTVATADGELVGKRGFLPTGEPRDDDFGFVDVYGFTGQEGAESNDSGLIHFKHRWLDPALGRWESPDPLFAAASARNLSNLGESTTGYAYVGNGFGDHVDPVGLVKDGATVPSGTPNKAVRVLGASKESTVGKAVPAGTADKAVRLLGSGTTRPLNVVRSQAANVSELVQALHPKTDMPMKSEQVSSWLKNEVGKAESLLALVDESRAAATRANHPEAVAVLEALQNRVADHAWNTGGALRLYTAREHDQMPQVPQTVPRIGSTAQEGQLPSANETARSGFRQDWADAKQNGGRYDSDSN